MTFQRNAAGSSVTSITIVHSVNLTRVTLVPAEPGQASCTPGQMPVVTAQPVGAMPLATAQPVGTVSQQAVIGNPVASPISNFSNVGAPPAGMEMKTMKWQAADPVETIRQLKQLLDVGAITPAEFEAKKAEQLSLM